MKKIYLFLAAFFILNSAHSQCMLYPVSLQSRINTSSTLIEGKVISSRSFWNTQHTYIFTSNLVHVTQVIRGVVNSNFIEVVTDGGTVEMTKQIVEPALELKANDEGVFILNPFIVESQYGYPVFQTNADQQGFIKFNFNEDKAYEPFKKYSSINGELKSALETIIGRSISMFNDPNISGKTGSQNSIASISSIVPASISAGTQSIITINGAAFGATQGASIVEFKNADDGGATFIQPHASQYVSWSNTAIQVIVPTKAGTAGTAGTGQVRVTVAGSPTLSPQPLTVTYGQLNVYSSNTVTTQQVFNTRHVSLNGNGGITWQMFTGFDGNALAKASFIRAFNTWRCATNINWQLGLTVATNTIAADNINVIRFDVGAELPAGVLGRCTSYFNGCFFGPTLYFFVSELDIAFDDATGWEYGPAFPVGGLFDFESVALHELGHGHQESHVIDPTDVMHWSIAPNTYNRSLIANDQNNGVNVMNRNLSGGVCGQGVMIAISPASCSLTAPTSSFNVASPVCANSNVTLNSSASGGPTNWNWVMTSGVPNTSTLQNTSTTYAGPGTYTITLTTSNGIGTSAPYSKTVSVIAAPTIAVTSGSICLGGSVTLTANGATSYTWFPGGLTGSVQSLSPPNNQNYSVIGSNGTCTNVSVGTVTVVQTPTLSGSLTNTIICVGETTTITAVGATNYTINPGGIVTNPSPISPTVTTTYTVLGQTQGCAGNPAVVTLTVNLCTGANALKNTLEEIKIYPNPTQGAVTIDFDGTYSGKLSLFNSLGQMLMSKTIDVKENAMIDLSEFSKGIYIIRLSSGKNNNSYIKVVRD